MDNLGGTGMRYVQNPIISYKYADVGEELNSLPISAFKRNGLQDNVFSDQGVIRYICQSPKMAIVPEEQPEPMAEDHRCRHSIVDKSKCDNCCVRRELFKHGCNCVLRRCNKCSSPMK